MSKTDKINALFDEWIIEHKFNSFMKDGIVDEEKYENILFLMKDVNNSDIINTDELYHDIVVL